MTRTRIQSGPASFAGAGPADMRPNEGARRLRPQIREEILDAVERQLETIGYAGMTIEEVARHAGIGKGTVYLHFASKGDLALSSIDRLIERLLGQLESIATRAEPAAERLHRMLVTRVLYRFDHVRQDHQSLDQMLAVLRTSLLSRREEWFEREAMLLARGIAEGRPEPAEESSRRDARSLVTATNSLLPYSLSKAELGRRSRLEERVGALVDILLRGLDPQLSTNRGIST
ncbi:MAG: TetR family transcriptional regulator [bacterium]|nr:MAG: TetR family transcriptional regulator [bacterium]